MSNIGFFFIKGLKVDKANEMKALFVLKISKRIVGTNEMEKK